MHVLVLTIEGLCAGVLPELPQYSRNYLHIISYVCICVHVCLFMCMCVNMNGVSFCSGSMQVIAVRRTKQRGKQCSEYDQRAHSSKQSIILLSGMFRSGMWNPHLYKWRCHNSKFMFAAILYDSIQVK